MNLWENGRTTVFAGRTEYPSSMCGILVCTDGGIDERSFRSALHLLHHRGPDANGYARCGPCQLGHTRLKVVDIDDRSNQPFVSRNGRYVLVFNGEIYNYAELAHSHRLSPATTGDTEIVVELFAKLGPAMLPALNGMFSLVILDTETNEVLAARDRLGVKPLYIHRSSRGCMFSSEVAPILALTGGAPFDEIGLRQYRKLRTFFNGRTAYRGIEMFPAGHYLAGETLRQYWQLPTDPQDPPEDDELRQLVVESINARLIADVPVGSYLSGGIDSTIIAAISETPHTWTVGLKLHNEFDWARLAASHLGSIHHEVDVTPEEFIDTTAEMIARRREPLSVPNEVLIYRLTRAVKELNTVILSGEGADELFFGYDRIFRWAMGAEQWSWQEFDRLYSYGSHKDYEILEDALASSISLNNPLDVLAHFFQTAHLHGLLRRLDNATMMCSVEARVPFVDHHPLIERLAGVSSDYRMSGGIVKRPLKRVFADILPPAIIDRRKVGFDVPLAALPLPVTDSAMTPMDRWLEFNLTQLCGRDFTTRELFA